MAQIIKHRRGTAAQLKTVTLRKGEIGVSTGSVDNLETPIVHIGDGVNQTGFVVGRLHQGSTVPTLNAADIGASLNNIIFHDSLHYKLMRLHTAGNENLDLTGNIANRAVTGSLTLTDKLLVEGTGTGVSASGHVTASIGMLSSRLDVYSAANATAISASGYITASGVFVSGDIHAVGNITFQGGTDGTIQLGDSAGDNISAQGDFISSIIPNASDSFNLGSSDQRWDTLFLSGSINATGGNHAISAQDAKTIALSSEDGAITIDSTGGGVSIDAAAASNFTLSDGDLSLIADGADNKVVIKGDNTGGTAVHIDANENAASVVHIEAGKLDVDASAAIELNAGAASNLTTSAGALTLEGATGVTVTSTGGTLLLNGTGQTVDIDSAALDIDASGAINIDSATSIGIGTNADKPITIESTTLDIDGSGAITIDTTSTIGIGSDAAAGNISIGTNTTARDITIGNGTGNTKLDLDAGTGGVDVDSTGPIDLSTTSDTATAIRLLTNSGTSEQIVITNTQGTNAAAIDLNASAGGVTIDAASGVSIDAGAASNLTTSGGVLTLDGKTGLDLKENGTAVIAIDNDRNVLFSQTGGSTSTPDVKVAGYTELAGLVEISNTTDATTVSAAALVVDGGVGVAKDLIVGEDLTVVGKMHVQGALTVISSSQLDIGDNIIELNTFGNTNNGGINIVDAAGTAHTGSLLWNATDDYFQSGLVGGTYYRIPEQATGTALTENKVLIADANGRIEPSANITDDGSTIDVNDVDITSIDKLEGVNGDTFIDMGVASTLTTSGSIIPDASALDDLGSASKKFRDIFASRNVDIDGTLDVAGIADFQSRVDAQNGLQVSGSALMIGSDLEIEYSTSSTHRLMFQNGTDNTVDFVGDPQSTDTNGSTAGEYVQWDGSAFVMTQTIDGGSF